MVKKILYRLKTRQKSGIPAILSEKISYTIKKELKGSNMAGPQNKQKN
jgi:hypothetical protein